MGQHIAHQATHRPVSPGIPLWAMLAFLKGSDEKKKATTLPPFPPLVSLSYTLDPIIRKSTHQMDFLMHQGLMQETTALREEKDGEVKNSTFMQV